MGDNHYFSEELYFSLKKWKLALFKSATSRYLFACAVYLVYSVAMVLIPDPSISPSDKDRLYFLFGIIHLVNSFMFIWTWEDKSFFDKVMIPEYFNVAGALLYLWSSTLYGHDYVSDDDDAGYSSSFYFERKLEFTASIIEIFAAFGWIYSWHVEYLELIARVPGPIPGRGWTFDDPDLTANITIAIAAIIYFVYNLQLMLQYNLYETNKLYQLGDKVYLINAVIYCIAALRDCSWFWFLPRYGQYRTITEIMNSKDELEGLDIHDYSKVDNMKDKLMSSEKSESA